MDVISDAEFRNFFCLLVQMQAGEVWDTVADGVIYRATPDLYVHRITIAKAGLHDAAVEAGDKAVFWFASGNRNETALTWRAVRTNIWPSGRGSHVCLAT